MNTNQIVSGRLGTMPTEPMNRFIERALAVPESDEPLVCRRVVQNGVVIAALHPVAGPIYWDFEDNSDCNAPDYYGITGDLASATVFKSGYYRGQQFMSYRADCLSELSDFEEVWDEETGEYDYVWQHCWQLEELARKGKCAPEEFGTWLDQATWVEYPAPVRVHFLRDFNGYIGYRPEWTHDAEEAIHWSREEVANGDDLDLELARSFGRLVPLSQAMDVKPLVRNYSAVNHALEADYAFTLHRLGLGRRRNWEASDSGVASWLGDMQESAWIHAARAGVAHVRAGEVLPVSGHIARFPELLARFDMAASLARHELAWRPAAISDVLEHGQ